jgi:BlaI family penicillinase repressor
VLKSFFGGSPQRLAQQLIEDEALTLEDIDALRAEVLKQSEEKGGGA